MYSHKKRKNYKNIKPHQKYQVSETSVGSSVWEYADEPNASKHVKFDTDYGYSSHNEFYSGRQNNFYSYPYYNDSINTMYDTGNEFQNYYDSEESQYTYYRQVPQQILYTETDSVFTMADSDYENSGYDYQTKNSQNYRQRHKGRNQLSRNTKNTFGENVAIYFAQEPRSHHAFQFKNSRHDNSSPSEQDTRKESITEIDEETDYTTDKDNHKINDMRQPVHQVYRTNIAENEGAFKKEPTKKDEEMVISVTDYDNVPLLAFETTNSKNIKTQNSLTRVVYLPILVSGMKNNDNILPSGNRNINNQSINSQHFEIAEKPIENIKVYAALNTGQKSIFEQSNEQEKSLELKSEKLGSITNRGPKSGNRMSNLDSEQRTSKKKYTNLPSILKVTVRKSPVSEKKPSKIKNTTSNTSLASGNTVLGVVGKKKKISDKKGIEKKSMRKSKSNISDKSLSSSTSSKTNSQASTRRKRKSRAGDSSIKLPTGQTPHGNIEGSSYYSDSHQQEIERNNSKKQEQSKLSISKPTNFNNKETNSRIEVKNIQSQIKTDESKGELPINKKQNNEVSKNLSSLSLPETNGKNLKTARLSTITTMNHPHSSMIGRSQITKKSVLPTDLTFEKNSKRAAEMSFPRQQSVIKSKENKNIDLENMERDRNERQCSKENEPIQGADKSLVKKSTINRANSTLQRKNVAQRQGGNVGLEQNKEAGNNLQRQLSDQSQTTQGGRLSVIKESTKEGNTSEAQNQTTAMFRKSLVKESKIERETTPAEDQPTQMIRKSLAKGSRIEGENTTGQNQATSVFRKSLVKESQIEHETTPAEDQQTQIIGKSLAKGSRIEGENTTAENQAKKSLTKGNKIDMETSLFQSQVLEGSDDKEVKSIYLRQSQIDEDQSIELNIDITKSVLKENKDATDQRKSTGWRKGQIFQPQIQEKVNEDFKKSFVKTEATNVADKDVMTQIDSIPLEAKIKSKIINDSDNDQEQHRRSIIEDTKSSVTRLSKGFGTDKEKKEGDTAVGVKDEADEKNDKSVKATCEKESTIEGRESSKVRRNSNQKTFTKSLNESKINRISVPEELSKPKNEQGLINQNDRGTVAGKGFQKSFSERKSIVYHEKKSISALNEKSNIKIVKGHSMIDKPQNFFQYLMKLKNYEFFNLVTHCFRISQFILGVSTYDKFIEVLGNFN